MHGIILIEDMAEVYGADGGLPDIFFNAAAAFLAYSLTHVMIKGLVSLPTPSPDTINQKFTGCEEVDKFRFEGFWRVGVVSRHL